MSELLTQAMQRGAAFDLMRKNYLLLQNLQVQL